MATPARRIAPPIAQRLARGISASLTRAARTGKMSRTGHFTRTRGIRNPADSGARHGVGAQTPAPGPVGQSVPAATVAATVSVGASLARATFGPPPERCRTGARRGSGAPFPPPHEAHTSRTGPSNFPPRTCAPADRRVGVRGSHRLRRDPPSRYAPLRGQPHRSGSGAGAGRASVRQRGRFSVSGGGRTSGRPSRVVPDASRRNAYAAGRVARFLPTERVVGRIGGRESSGDACAGSGDTTATTQPRTN